MEYLIAIPAFILGWFSAKWWLFGKLTPNKVPTAQYEVRLERTARGEVYSQVVYTGNDLIEAKRVYYNAAGPARTAVSLYTRGSHTASRQI